jgi:lysozyme
VDPILRAQLVRDEGLRLKAYRDTNGFWTIGVGHLLGKSDVPRVAEITEREAYAWLADDLTEAEDICHRLFPYWVLIDAPRQRALLNMAFNRGNHMVESTTITPALQRALVGPIGADWASVTAAIKASPWAAQVKDRATRLAKQLETGVDQ